MKIWLFGAPSSGLIPSCSEVGISVAGPLCPPALRDCVRVFTSVPLVLGAWSRASQKRVRFSLIVSAVLVMVTRNREDIYFYTVKGSAFLHTQEGLRQEKKIIQLSECSSGTTQTFLVVLILSPTVWFCQHGLPFWHAWWCQKVTALATRSHHAMWYVPIKLLQQWEVLI